MCSRFFITITKARRVTGFFLACFTRGACFAKLWGMTDIERSDIERFTELYRSFGIECVVNTDEDGFQMIYLSEGTYPDDENTVSDKITGNVDAYTAIIFTPDGKFSEQTIWA